MLMESPCTPGRGVFSFSSNVSGRRRNFPSKWIDAEKWVTSSGHDSPAHSLKNTQFDGFKHQVCLSKNPKTFWNLIKFESLNENVAVKLKSRMGFWDFAGGSCLFREI